MPGILLMLVVLPLAASLESSERSRAFAPPFQAPRSSVQADVDAVRKLEMSRLAAGLRKDVNAVAAATADDYMQIDPDGVVLDKAATIDRIKSSYAQLTANPVDEMTIRIYGDTAILTGRATPHGILNGKEFNDAIRYTRVYVRRDGTWQVVLFQQTRVR